MLPMIRTENLKATRKLLLRGKNVFQVQKNPQYHIFNLNKCTLFTYQINQHHF